MAEIYEKRKSISLKYTDILVSHRYSSLMNILVCFFIPDNDSDSVFSEF